MHATPAVNPQFHSQTKENMTLVKTKFGSECKIGDKMIDAVCKDDFYLSILNFSSAMCQPPPPPEAGHNPTLAFYP